MQFFSEEAFNAWIKSVTYSEYVFRIKVVLFGVVAIYLVLFLLFFFAFKNKRGTISPKDINANTIIDDTFKVTFLRRDESEFNIIKEAADKLSFIVYPKVKTTELVSARTHLKGYPEIQARLHCHHVDFVICNKRNHVEAVVLLNKNKPITQEEYLLRRYAEAALGAHGYKIIRAETVHPDILNCLK